MNKKRSKETEIEEIAKRAHAGEDVSSHFTGRHLAKQRISLDLPLRFLSRGHPMPGDGFPGRFERRLATRAGHHRGLLRAGRKGGSAQRSGQQPQRSRRRGLGANAGARRADG